MELKIIATNATGAYRYYIDGKRVSREAYDSARANSKTFDSFSTVTNEKTTTNTCQARL